MRLSVSQKNIRRAILHTERITSRNLSLPILNNIVLKTENGRLKVLATNLEIGISVFVGAKIEEVGEIAVPGRIFSEFINSIPDENITLTTKGNHLYIQSALYKTHILGFDTKEYPLIPKIKSEPICVIPSDTLKDALEIVMGAMAISDARLELAGVYTHFSPKAINFAATDVFRLAECSVPVKAINDHGVIVPRGTIAELARIAGEIEGVFEVRIGDNQISYTTSDIELVSRLIDGKYPDYKRVIPEKFVTKVLIEHGALEQAARLAGLFSSSISDIKLSGENKTLTITAHNTDKGEIQAAVPAVIKGELFEVSLNFHYLLDGLKAVRSEKIVLEFTGRGSPFVIKPESQANDSVYLIMPLRS